MHVLFFVAALVVAARGSIYGEPTGDTYPDCGSPPWAVYPAGSGWTTCGDVPPAVGTSPLTYWAGLDSSDSSVSELTGSVINRAGKDQMDIWHFALTQDTSFIVKCHVTAATDGVDQSTTFILSTGATGPTTSTGSGVQSVTCTCQQDVPGLVTVPSVSVTGQKFFFWNVITASGSEKVDYQIFFNADGKGTGDPHFDGYMGQKFEFQGASDHFYQLYSDKVLAVNTLVSKWEGPRSKVTPNSTVMTAFGLMFGRRFLSVDTSSLAKNGNLMLNTNTGSVVMSNSTQHKFDSCLSVAWKAPMLTVLYRDYEVTISWNWRDYNDRYFLDVDIDLPERLLDGVARGGLLGQTTSSAPPSLARELFETSSLTSADAKTNQWRPSDSVCH